MKEIIMTPEQELRQEYPHEMEEWPYEERRRRTAKEIIKDILLVVRNVLLGIGKVLLYGLIGTVGLVVLGLIVVFFSKHLEALKIVGYVLLGAVCVGAVMALVYGLICLCRWLVDGMISFYGWIKDLKENGGRKRRRGPMSREEYRTMLWNEEHTYHHPRRRKKYGREVYRHPYEFEYRTSLERPHYFVKENR